MTTETNFQESINIEASEGCKKNLLLERARACANCVRAKTKCSLVLSAGTICERCLRTKKDCKPQPPPRKRKPAVRKAANKVKRLEEKIDGLVDFLKSTSEIDTPSSKSTSFNTASLNSVLENNANGFLDQTVEIGNNKASSLDASFESNLSRPSVIISPFSTPAAVSVAPFGIERISESDTENAQLHLLRFRESFLSQLPFLVIPPWVTASRLQQEKPILWLCIMTVTSINSIQQINLSGKVRELLGRVAYIESSRDLDLLQGILVIITWDRRIGMNKPIFTSLVQFAISVLYDLDLDKVPPTDMGFALMHSVKGEYSPSAQSTKLPTMEERRALLGCYLISTVLSSSRKGQSLRWTPYFDDCLQALQAAKEVESDEMLVQMIKFRLVSEKVVHFPCFALGGMGLSDGIPATLYVKSLQWELDQSVAATPTNLVNDKILLLERYYTEFRIYEIGFLQSHAVFIEQPTLRFECLFACLQAIKSFCNMLATLEPTQYLGLSALVFAEMTCSLTSLCRLAMCDYPGWDRDTVHSTINVSAFLEELENRYARVKGAVGIDAGSPDSSHDFFTAKASRLRSMRESWDALTLPAISAQELESFSADFLDMWNR